MVNAAFSSCLEIYGGGTAAGSASEVRTCNGANNQQFARASNSELQVYTSVLTMCLDSNGATSPGSAVVIENCTVASISLSKPVVPERSFCVDNRNDHSRPRAPCYQGRPRRP
ncbi:RICIN domain-containing protein [Streptomyces sp. NPDC048665]|uniref:RICIN domain-containing protein n=1 Tax=Streptomyces sp. NPDC048665 TaxID=3155490 RepID=UPI00343B675F